MSPEEQQRRKQAIAAARRANKELPYKPEPYSQGPYAQAAHASGGKLIGIPLNRAKFDAELAAHAPGCASPVYPYGLEAGPVKCGARLNGELVFCPYCKPANVAESVVNILLEQEDERIVSAAIKTRSGSVFTGRTHMDAFLAAEAAGVGEDDFVKDDGGFWTSAGRYVQRHEASLIARKSKQLRNVNLKDWPSDEPFELDASMLRK